MLLGVSIAHYERLNAIVRGTPNSVRTVAVILSILAPLTQAGLNPARDFSTRLLSCLAG